jgi:hypothetical protein
MKRPRLMPLAAAVILGLPLLSCRNTGQGRNLRDRIIAADTLKYCRMPDACFNPHVLSVENGYYVTVFVGSKPHYEHVPAKELPKYLLQIPMQSWPRGPSITVSPTDDVVDQNAVQQNFHAAQQLCRSMGLDVQVRFGG